MKENKEKFNQFISNLVEHGYAKPYRKLPMDNIVFPSFKENKFVSLLFRQMIRTKEQPNGCLYDEDTYQIVFRLINGKLLMNGMIDAYTWKSDKVRKSKGIPIGYATQEASENLAYVFPEMKDKEELKILMDFFDLINFNLLLVHTDAEDRICIEVTPELYQNGLIYTVDEWMAVDANGDAEITELNVGDFVVVGMNGAYCTRGEEFRETHELIG